MQPHLMFKLKHNNLRDITPRAARGFQRTLSPPHRRPLTSYLNGYTWRDSHGNHYPNPAGFQTTTTRRSVSLLSSSNSIKTSSLDRVRLITHSTSSHAPFNSAQQRKPPLSDKEPSNQDTGVSRITTIMEETKVPPSSSSSVAANVSESEVNTVNNDIKPCQDASTSQSAPASAAPAEEQPALPPLSPAEHKTYNRLAVQMDYFHEHFRSIWKTLYTACTNNKRPANMSLKQFIDEGLRLTQYLEAHHSIEENYLYPILAKKMPQFRVAHGHGSKKSKGKGGGGSGDCDLLKQHEEIHKGMDVFSEYLRACKNRETELDLAVLKEKMDSWGDVLFKHLDDEVKELEAENMRKYWTIDEVKVIPM
ncbi:hypothetical protein V8F20_008724 [Naviculisporaceae sp. PSN 640]